MAKDNEWQDLVRNIRAIVGLVVLLLLVLPFVFKFLKYLFTTRNYLAVALIFLLLTAGLWLVRENTRPDFFLCNACGLEYTCQQDNTYQPNGYCMAASDHKHCGERIDFWGARPAQVLDWMKADAERLKQAFEAFVADGAEGAVSTAQGNQG